MQKVGIRKYHITQSDFPLQCEVCAKNLPICLAVVGDIQIRDETGSIRSLPVEVAVDHANLAVRFTILEPDGNPPLTIIAVISCTFPNDPPDNSAYEVTITAAGGDQVKTTGSAPTINPRIVILTLNYSGEVDS